MARSVKTARDTRISKQPYPGDLYQWSAQQIKHGKSLPLSLSDCKRYLALARVNIYWQEPFVGTDPKNIPDQCQFLLWQDQQKMFHVAIPLIDGDTRAFLGVENAQLHLYWDDGLGNTSKDAKQLLYTLSGKRAHPLISEAMQHVSKITGTFQLRDEKSVPDFIDYLGWCTWDAFYQDVDQNKVRRGLESFKDGGVQLGHMILDDGMLAHSNEMLDSFVANKTKFPNGVAAIAKMAKKDFNLHSFGIWHAFQGYWRGLNKDGELGNHYRSFANRGKIRPWEGADKLVSLRCIDPQDIHRFYFDFYRYLKSQDVDMVKVDNQSALERYTHHKRGRVASMRAYQEAFQGAGQHFFDGNILHCMSMGSDVGLNMFSSNAYRNSDDYFPKKDSTAQQHHIKVNAYNACLSSHFCFPDWDMFQTHSPCPEFHAAARAISGGPVYVCDYPGKQNFKILKRMGLSDGRTLRCPQPALPTEDCLFINPELEKKALKLYNHNNEILLLGLFHCYNGQDDITASFKISDHPDAINTEYACYRFEDQSLSTHKRGDKQTVTLEHADHEIVTCSPIAKGIAALGLLDKYNGSAAIDAHGWSGKEYFCSLITGSKRIGFYCGKKPSRVLVNGKTVKFRYHNKLLQVQASDKSPCDIIILT